MKKEKLKKRLQRNIKVLDKKLFVQSVILIVSLLSTLVSITAYTITEYNFWVGLAVITGLLWFTFLTVTNTTCINITLLQLAFCRLTQTETKTEKKD